MHVPSSAISEARDLVAAATNIAVLSGAGLSKASGIPTYRDAGGLWQRVENAKYSHIAAYRTAPGSFRQFWRARQREVRRARPNAGHLALRELQRLKTTTLITQNVDGLLQAAGCTDVIELHGSLSRHSCGQCGERRLSLLGRCLRCRGHMRPEVILFGEELPRDAHLRALESARRCDLFLLVGSTAIVAPAAELPVLALKAGAKLIVVDTEPPLLAHAADVVLTGPAENVLPELAHGIRL